MRKKLAIFLVFIMALTMLTGCSKANKDDKMKITKKVNDVTWEKAAKTIKILEFFPEPDVDEIDCCTNFSANFRMEKNYNEFARAYMKKLEAQGFTNTRDYSVGDIYEVYSKSLPSGSKYKGVIVYVRAFKPKYDIGYNVSFIYKTY